MKVVGTLARDSDGAAAQFGAGGGGSYTPPRENYYANGLYYGKELAHKSLATPTYVANALYAFPFRRLIRIDALTVQVNTAASGKNIIMGVYTSDPLTGYPKSLQRTSGSISVGTTGQKIGTFAAYDCDGTEWLAFNNDANTAVFEAMCATGSPTGAGLTYDNGAMGLAVPSQIFGALPATFPSGAAGFGSGTHVAIMARGSNT